MGSGGFGRVHVIESEGVAPHVAKFIPKDPGADRELLFPRFPGIRNVVPVADTGEWEAYWIIVMPKAEMSLADLLSNAGGPLPEDQATPILLDMAEALASMKDHVVHRDVKPANILFLDGRWRLADFGISRYAEATTAKNTRKFAWTPPYAAPERWREERATSATDVYAFGCVAYHLLAGHPPFGGPESHDYRRQHLDDAPAPIPNVAPEMASLVDECLTKAPWARPDPESILSRLKRVGGSQTEGARRLQEANSQVVRQQVERASIESAAQSERERKGGLREAAEKSLMRIVTMLHDQIRSLASASVADRPSTNGWRASLGRAALSVAAFSQADEVFAPLGDVKWEILASSTIALRTPSDRDGYEGMAHSLWYFRQSENDPYRWYELAFKVNALYRYRSTVNPFSLPPGNGDAEFALSPGMHRIDVARHPSPVDQGAEENFVEEWISRLADAVAGA
ncbi:MAG: serine/threonine-protein kinase [Gemmatimonadota bacterium]|nr:serine/threonine-protein kinase [Gemmatimonadota bacterium]